MVSNDQLIEIVIQIFNTTLEMPIMATKKEIIVNGKDRFLSGCINILGGWEGVIVVEMPEKLTQKISAKMFQKDLSSVNIEDMRDSLGEVTNMIGGNLKALFPDPSSLALPVVTEGMDYRVRIRGGEVIKVQCFEVDNYVMQVTMVKKVSV